MNSKNIILKAQNLSKVYQEGVFSTSVLSHLDLEILSGERVAIMGPSGSGKSTLLHLLGGLESPSEGKIWVMGEKLSADANHRARLRARYLGFIYQFHHLLPELTALENTALSAVISGQTIAEGLKMANTLLDRVGLASRRHHKPSELSGGERQRVAIARALANRPLCILADEPTGNLDQKNAENILALLEELHQEFHMCLVIVTPDETLARKLDRVLVMQDGCWA